MTVKFQKTSKTSKSFENNILSRAIQSAFENHLTIFHHGSCMQSRARQQKSSQNCERFEPRSHFAPVMFHRGRNKPNFKRDYLKDLKS